MSLYLVPLVLPVLLLCAPGARRQGDQAEGAREVQEVILEDVIVPAPELSTLQFPTEIQPDSRDFDAEEGHRA
jgi:hypothetical protein